MSVSDGTHDINGESAGQHGSDARAPAKKEAHTEEGNDLQREIDVLGQKQGHLVNQDAPRRSDRDRNLTEKGEALMLEKQKKLIGAFVLSYERWKRQAKEAKALLVGYCTEESLETLITDIGKRYDGTVRAYEELRKCCMPNPDIRRKIDSAKAITDKLIKMARDKLQRGLLDNSEAKQVRKQLRRTSEMGSIFSSFAESQISKQSKNSRSSKRSEIAAELAAHQAELRAQQEEKRQRTELARIQDEARKRREALEADASKRRIEREAEEAKLKAEMEAENARLEQEVQDKLSEIKQTQTQKKISMAEARMKAYEEEASDIVSEVDDVQDLLKDCESMEQKERLFYNAKNPPPMPLYQPYQAPVDNTAALVKALTDAMTLTRIPVPEPSVFSGDPLRYNDWRTSFRMLIDSKGIAGTEKIYYLRRYVGGDARKSIEGYFLVGTEASYQAAWAVLEDRYGNPFTVSRAFRDKLHQWPKISPKNSTGLREFADFLKSCEAAIPQVTGLEILNDCQENQRILSKLPDWLTSRWNRKVAEEEEEYGRFPSFSKFVRFIEREAKIACNPVTSLYALKEMDSERPAPSSKRPVGANTLSTGTTEEESKGEKETVMSCSFCEKNGHTIINCRTFNEKALKEKQDYVKQNRLCFGCLKYGHNSRDCKRRSTCETCKMKHPTCLHENRNTTMPSERKEEVQKEDTIKAVVTHGIRRAIQTAKSAMIVPVWISSQREPEQEVLVYALLDTQSDTTFILDETSRALKSDLEPVQLKLSTITARDTLINCHRVRDLQVRGFNSALRVPLPTTYTRDFIPAYRSHIPTRDIARKWPHLESIAEKIPPLQSCEVALLIGYNCPQALAPRDIVSGQGNQPFAQRTDLGWTVVGCVDPRLDHEDAIGLSHRVIMREVCEDLTHSTADVVPSKVHYVGKTVIKEVLPTTKGIQILENDFVERKGDLSHVSQEDLKVMKIPEKSTHRREDGHHEMPLPFKSDRPKNRLKTRLRQEPITIMCDREETVHQANVIEEDRHDLRFLWWENRKLESQPIEYHTNVHSFGAARSPRCVNFGMKHIANYQGSESSEEARSFIERNFYVDDGLTSTNSTGAAIKLVREAQKIFAKGRLRHCKSVSDIEEATWDNPPSRELHPRWERRKYELPLCASLKITRRLQPTEFLRRWRKKYQMNLQPRQKWNTQRRNLKVDDLVPMRDDDAPRREWKLGKITETIPDENDLVTKAKPKIGNKTPYERDKTTEVATLEQPVQKKRSKLFYDSLRHGCPRHTFELG